MPMGMNVDRVCWNAWPKPARRAHSCTSLQRIGGTTAILEIISNLVVLKRCRIVTHYIAGYQRPATN